MNVRFERMNNRIQSRVTLFMQFLAVRSSDWLGLGGINQGNAQRSGLRRISCELSCASQYVSRS
jgi:hypothetical protein